MDTTPDDVRYRLTLAQGFLKEARDDHDLGQACPQERQLQGQVEGCWFAPRIRKARMRGVSLLTLLSADGDEMTIGSFQNPDVDGVIGTAPVH